MSHFFTKTAAPLSGLSEKKGGGEMEREQTTIRLPAEPEAERRFSLFFCTEEFSLRPELVRPNLKEYLWRFE